MSSLHEGSDAANGGTPEPGQVTTPQNTQLCSPPTQKAAARAACGGQPVDPDAPVQYIDGKAVVSTGGCSLMLGDSTAGKKVERWFWRGVTDGGEGFDVPLLSLFLLLGVESCDDREGLCMSSLLSRRALTMDDVLLKMGEIEIYEDWVEELLEGALLCGFAIY